MTLRTVTPEPNTEHHHHYPAKRDPLVIALLAVIALILFLLLCSDRGWAQGTQGANTYDPSGNLNVNIQAGGGTGGGPSDTAANAAASESDTARQKVIAVIRLLDTGQSAGSQLVTAKGDQTSGLWVNCKSGCAGGSSTPADTFATPTTAGLTLTFPMLWNGATFDRQYGDKTNGAFVNIKNSVALAVTGTFFQATQPVSASSLPLPTGASTAAKQPALGTAGSPSADIITVQGAASMTKLLVTPDSVALPANQSVNMNQVAGSNLGSTAVVNYGSTPAAVAVPGVNAFVTNVNANGQNTMANSAPVVIASNQSAVPVAGALSNNGAAASSNRVGTLGGVVQTDPANGTAYTQGRDAAPNVGTDGNLWVNIQPALRPVSYSTSKSFAGSSTTDNAVLPGNATNTVLVTRVIVTCIATTAGIQTVSIIKRSAADTSGTSAAMTAVPDDSTFGAAVSAPLSYTGTGPTVGSAVGNVDTAQIGCNASATAGPNDVYVLDRRLKPIVLRGTAQQLAVNFGAAITGGNLTVTYEWQEVKTITP